MKIDSEYENPYVDYSISVIESMKRNGEDLISILETAQELIDRYSIHEEKDIQQITNHIKLEVLDIDKFIKVNECQEVTNPVFFVKPGQPTDDGLLSYRIFGLTQDDKAGIFAYINLNKYFINPVCYKAWFKTDPKIKSVIGKTDYFSLDDKGNIVQDPRGKNGIEWLRANISKIKFKSSSNGESIRRDLKVRFLELNRNKMFTNKYIVIPVFYRDTNSNSSSKGSVGVGKINKLYQQLLLSAKAITDAQEYGFDMSGATDLKLQETLLEIYDWFCGTNNNNIQKDETGYGIKGKFGILRRANQSKTTDYAARLVISAPELKVNSPKEMRANFKNSVIPLSASIACFAPFVQFCVRRFFESEFAGTEQYPVVINGKVEMKNIKDPFIQFSDDRITTEMEQFIHGYNNRLIPVKVELEDGTFAYMNFKGRYQVAGSNPETIYNRRLTWLDILYISTVEATRNKMVLISRFPIDSRTNQFTSGIEVASTVETEPMYFNEEYYPYYPKFSDDDIGKDTSDMFVDTVNLSNLYLLGVGGDACIRQAYTNLLVA